jgi:hypothetical protein
VELLTCKHGRYDRRKFFLLLTQIGSGEKNAGDLFIAIDILVLRTIFVGGFCLMLLLYHALQCSPTPGTVKSFLEKGSSSQGGNPD